MRPPHFYSNMPPFPPNQFVPRPPQYGYRPGPFPQATPPRTPNFQQPPKAAPRLDSILETANRFLATAQSFQPYIQQAAPMIRNLPALWKLYRGFQSVPSQGQGVEQEISLENSRPTTNVRSESTPKQSYSPKPSLPKIYQPPFDFDDF